MTQAKKFEAVPGLIVAICFALAALEGYDIQAFGVAAPQLVVRLGLTPSQMGMAGSAAMVGLANKKENSTIASLLTPINIPLTMAAAERETPGIMASDCQTPIQKDFL